MTFLQLRDACLQENVDELDYAECILKNPEAPESKIAEFILFYRMNAGRSSERIEVWMRFEKQVLRIYGRLTDLLIENIFVTRCGSKGCSELSVGGLCDQCLVA